MDVWVLRIPSQVLMEIELDEFERGEVESCLQPGAEIHEILIALEIICRRFYEKQQVNQPNWQSPPVEQEAPPRVVVTGRIPPSPYSSIGLTPEEYTRIRAIIADGTGTPQNPYATRIETESERRARMTALAARHNIDVHALRDPAHEMLDMVGNSNRVWGEEHRGRVVALLRARNTAIEVGHEAAFIEVMEAIGRLINNLPRSEGLTAQISRAAAETESGPQAETASGLTHDYDYIRRTVERDVGDAWAAVPYIEQVDLMCRRRLVIVAQEQGDEQSRINRFVREYNTALHMVMANAHRRRAQRIVSQNPAHDGT